MLSIDGKKVNTEVANRDFKYYIFDWDDNILHMQTRIHLEKLTEVGTWEHIAVSSSVFSLIRRDTTHYRLYHDNKAAFIEFQDDHPAGDRDNSFVRDTENAIERVLSKQEAPGPSFKTFRRTLTEGRLFAIVTARGHASSTLRTGVRRFIDMVLTPEERETMLANLRGYRYSFDGTRTFGSDEDEINFYLGLNRYHAVTGPDFNEILSTSIGDKNASSEERKQYAIRDFVEHLFHVLERMAKSPKENHQMSIGFSDDDTANTASVQRYIKDALAKRYPSVKFCVYDTSDPGLEKGRKVVVSGQLDFDI